ncbi:aldehyde dehydrogenase family protein [Hyaloraphidium curvatum]|nr:aldehyde dehydrogenase family protein [Hyaloraphidium curvatum]
MPLCPGAEERARLTGGDDFALVSRGGQQEYTKFYINGEWVAPEGKTVLREVVNPATEQPTARIAMGSKADVDKAVKAARKAFETFSETDPAYRVELLEKIVAGIKKRIPDMAKVISDEMGAPLWFSNAAQAPGALGHFITAAKELKNFKWEEKRGKHIVRKEPIGVCGFITPWNWPANQIACKVAPAIAAGCTMILKPSEMAPLDAIVLTEVMHEAGVPAGVFNLINGDGPGVGQELSSHPDIDMVSFTGSTRAGILVAQAAATTVKRVAQELGGKSANIITEDAPLEKAITNGVVTMMRNTGQSCNAPSRMLVPRSKYEEAVKIAAKVAETIKVVDPAKATERTGEVIGPLANGNQFAKVNALIQKGIQEGARVVAGGPGRPEGFSKGYFVKPTVFADVNNQMTIAREEIFGPVLCMIPYNDLEEAVKIANDTEYGLAGYVYAKDIPTAAKIAKKIRAGMLHLNGAGIANELPFGGYKASGNGREWGQEGISEFLEVKSMINAANL